MNMDHVWQVWCWNVVKEESWRKAAKKAKTAQGVVVVQFVFVTRINVVVSLNNTSLLRLWLEEEEERHSLAIYLSTNKV